jgi:hypothetical protein
MAWPPSRVAPGVNGRGDFGDELAVELDGPGVLTAVSGRGGMFVEAIDLGRRLVVGGQADLHHIILDDDTERRGQESVGCGDAQDGFCFRQLTEIGIVGGRENQVSDGDGKGYHTVSGILRAPGGASCLTRLQRIWWTMSRRLAKCRNPEKDPTQKIVAGCPELGGGLSLRHLPRG